MTSPNIIYGVVDRITYTLCDMHRMSKMEGINNSPLLLDLQMVVVEITRQLFLDLGVVRIEQ